MPAGGAYVAQLSLSIIPTDDVMTSFSSSDIAETARDDVVTGALQTLQNRSADILNAIDDGVFFLDEKGDAIFINEAAARLLGFANRELLGRSMHELTHHHYPDGSEFPAEECPILSSVTDGVQQRVGGDIFWTKSGAALPVDYTSIPIKDGRTVIGVVVTFRDTSDQQRADEQTTRLASERAARAEAEEAREALRKSEEQYRFLAETIPVQIWTARPDGALDYVSRRVSEYFGLSAAQILEDGWKNIVHTDDLPGVAARWMHSLATAEPYEVEFRLRGSDGVYRWHLARAQAQVDDTGAAVRWYGTNTLIEDQRQKSE
jgi:PAS domain S-box-containing protein